MEKLAKYRSKFKLSVNIQKDKNDTDRKVYRMGNKLNEDRKQRHRDWQTDRIHKHPNIQTNDRDLHTYR